LKADVGDTPIRSAEAFDSVLTDWLDLRNMLQVAQSVAVPALARTESRGAHQRDDHLGLDDAWSVNQVVSLSDGAINLRKVMPTTGKVAA
jgi:succinate dehydrogenase / fumarate reductase, flavoprotein subunit